VPTQQGDARCFAVLGSAGDMKARVAFDTDEQVAGLFILAPETP
jgi:hypothetical protein